MICEQRWAAGVFINHFYTQGCLGIFRILKGFIHRNYRGKPIWICEVSAPYAACGYFNKKTDG